MAIFYRHFAQPIDTIQEIYHQVHYSHLPSDILINANYTPIKILIWTDYNVNNLLRHNTCWAHLLLAPLFSIYFLLAVIYSLNHPLSPALTVTEFVFFQDARLYCLCVVRRNYFFSYRLFYKFHSFANRITLAQFQWLFK